MPLSARVSLAAQRIIREAFDDLRRTISDKDSADFATTTLEKVIEAAHKIEDQLAARQLLRNMRRLTALFEGLQYYSKSIEVACNGTPYMPWIWAPITVILKVASDYVDAFDKLIVAYARIAEPLARFKIFHQTYPSNMELQQTFAAFYSDILKFHKEAYKFVRRSGWRVFFMTSWGRFQRRFDSIIDDLRAHEKLVDATANAVGQSEVKRIREDVEAVRREARERIAEEEKERTTSQYVDIVCWLKMDNSDQAKIFDSVTAEPQRYPETCDWILRQHRVTSWMRCSTESPFLVLHGHPGTGKSVLTTKIATFLRSSGKSLVISHICTYSQAASTEYDQVLKSVLLQLVQHDTNLVAYIYEEFLLKKKSVTAQAMERIIMEVIGAVSENPSQTKYVHIVLDGLDECDEEKQSKIINLLERMVAVAFTSASTVCKVLVSSRMPPNLARKLRQKHVVSLSSERAALGKAIASYAAQRLCELQKRMEFTDAELKELEIQLTKKADGMFLWARLVLNYLTNNLFVRKHEVLDAVNTLPRELSEFYRQILEQIISHFDQRSVSRLQSIFGWIAFAKRPLRKAELRSALSFSAEAENVNVEELAPTYLFDRCKPLIEERNDTTFAFIHVSVKEFLQSPESNVILDELSRAYEQGLVTALCLLSGLDVFQHSYSHQARSVRVVRGLHGLHLYASEYWVEYLLDISASDNSLDTSSMFFARSRELSVILNSLRGAERQEVGRELVDSRLLHIESHPDLWNAAKTITSERATRSLPSSEAVDEPSDITNLPTLLRNYQRTVKELLQLFRHPGVSAQELERFKEDFRSAAFTCRLWSCPLASTGFKSEALRDDHERSHVPRISCEISGCQYPPFNSTSALKKHHAKQHAHGVPRIKIRALGDPVRLLAASNVPRQQYHRQNTAGREQAKSKSPGIASERPTQTPVSTRDDYWEASAQETGFTEANAADMKQQRDAPLQDSMQKGQNSVDVGGCQETAVQHGQTSTSNALGDLDLNLLDSKYERSDHDWVAVFNPQVSRVLDVKLVNTFDDDSLVSCVSISSDGKYVATGCYKAAKIYELKSGAMVCILNHLRYSNDAAGTWVCCVRFTPGDRYLVTISVDKVVRVWDIRARRILNKLYNDRLDTYCLDVSRDGRTIAFLSDNSTVCLWNFTSNPPKYLLTSQGYLTAVAISPDSQYVAVGSDNGTVDIRHIYDGSQNGFCGGHDGHVDSVSSVVFSPDGTNLVSGSLDGTIKTWNLDNQPGLFRAQCIRTVESHSGAVLDVTSTPDGAWILSGSGHDVQFWDAQTGVSQLRLLGHKNPVNCVAQSQIGGYFATCAGTDTITKIWSYSKIN